MEIVSTNMKGIDDLQTQLFRCKQDILDRNEFDSRQQLAQLYWDFLRSVFQDRTAIWTTQLNMYQRELVQKDKELKEMTREANKYKLQIKQLKRMNKDLEQLLPMAEHSAEQQTTRKIVEFKSVHFINPDVINDDEAHDIIMRRFYHKRRSTLKNGNPMRMSYNFGKVNPVSTMCTVM